MLKLLKYELIGSYRQYVLSFVIFLLLCIVSPFVPLINTDTFAGILMCGVGGIMVSIFINIIMGFNKSMFKKPGYLTLTLPVSTNQIVGSKVIGSVIWTLVGTLVLLLGGSILAVIIEGVEMSVFINGVQVILAEIGKNIGDFVGGIFVSVTSLMALILSFFFTITLTQTKYVPKYKVVVGIIGYFIALFIVIQITSSSSIDYYLTSLDYMGTSVIANIVNCVASSIFFFGTVYLIDHKIEVE